MENFRAMTLAHENRLIKYYKRGFGSLLQKRKPTGTLLLEFVGGLLLFSDLVFRNTKRKSTGKNNDTGLQNQPTKTKTDKTKTNSTTKTSTTTTIRTNTTTTTDGRSNSNKFGEK